MGSDGDTTGWTLQPDSIDLSRAAVTITAGDVDKPVTVSQLLFVRRPAARRYRNRTPSTSIVNVFCGPTIVLGSRPASSA